MELQAQSDDRFRKSFVLALTIACTAMFLAMIWGFVEALLLAAIFSGILYPLYSRIKRAMKGRSTIASLLTLVIALLMIVIPLLLLLGLITEQALVVTGEVQPWLQTQIDNSAASGGKLPSWLPYADTLEPYHDQISAKIATIAEHTAVYLGAILGRATQGTVMFFLNLFVMLYAMFFFLISGPELVRKLMSYTPISAADDEKLVQVSLSMSRATIKGTLVIGIIQGALGGIGFAVAGINSAVFWGAVMAVLSVLPGIGSMLLWVPAVIYLFLAGDVVASIALLAWCAGVVGTIDNVLRPILVGRDTEMPGLLILLATLGGLSLFGASGLVLGPILAALFLAVLAIYSRVFEDLLIEPEEEVIDGSEN